MPDLYAFLLLSLFVWRMSSLLVLEDGPPIRRDAAGEYHHLFEWLRHRAGVRHEAGEQVAEGWAEVFLCVWCMSLWIGFIVAAAWLLFPGLHTAILMLCLPFALSAVAVILSGVANGKS